MIRDPRQLVAGGIGTLVPVAVVVRSIPVDGRITNLLVQLPAVMRNGSTWVNNVFEIRAIGITGWEVIGIVTVGTVLAAKILGEIANGNWSLAARQDKRGKPPQGPRNG